jgi:2-iminobutanoate/2-iminopropanoate deaminase
MRQEYRVDGLQKPISHYTDAVRFNDLVFVSGLAAFDENDRLVGGEEVAAQARQIFKNMRKVLDTVGADFSDILKVTVFLTNVEDRAKINPIREEFFGSSRAASTLVGVKELALPGMKIEIEAVVGLSSKTGKKKP